MFTLRKFITPTLSGNMFCSQKSAKNNFNEMWKWKQLECYTDLPKVNANNGYYNHTVYKPETETLRQIPPKCQKTNNYILITTDTKTKPEQQKEKKMCGLISFTSEV